MRLPSCPLEEALRARVRLLATTLRPSTVSGYQGTAKMFLTYLKSFPAVRQPADLRRDPHILGWLEHLWSRPCLRSGRPACASTRAARLLQLGRLFELLADHRHPPRPGLLLGADIPRPDQLLPRPLTPEQDAALEAELRCRNDLLSNALLLTRHTGLRIGECVDLAPDCVRHLGGDRWAVHVPLGKLHTDRLVPVDEEARAVAARLAFLRTLPPAAEEFLLPRPKGRTALCNDLRAALREATTEAGITCKIVPHQLRHTYATSMLRAGVSLPALMKLLGHRTANMTLRYVEITQQDLQREFRLAQAQSRHRVPLPPALDAAEPPGANAALVVDRLSGAMRVLDLYRQQNAESEGKPFQLLARRLLRVRERFQKLIQKAKNEK